jgi:hypothetical protein
MSTLDFLFCDPLKRADSRFFNFPFFNFKAIDFQLIECNIGFLDSHTQCGIQKFIGASKSIHFCLDYQKASGI